MRPPRVGICEFTTLPASFEEDVAAYSGAGVGGIGVLELKLEGADDPRRRLRAAGLVATACVPAVPSILPLPTMPGPDDVEERVERLCAGVRRLAELDPACVLFLTGPGEERRAEVVEGVRAVAAAGAAAGVRVALEPMHPDEHETFSFLHSLADARDLLDEAGAGEVGFLYDCSHVGLDPDLEQLAPRVAGVHLREPVPELAPILRALDAAGYRGSYDVELFDEDLWAMEPAAVARRCRDAFLRVWETV